MLKSPKTWDHTQTILIKETIFLESWQFSLWKSKNQGFHNPQYTNPQRDITYHTTMLFYEPVTPNRNPNFLLGSFSINDGNGNYNAIN